MNKWFFLLSVIFLTFSNVYGAIPSSERKIVITQFKFNPNDFYSEVKSNEIILFEVEEEDINDVLRNYFSFAKPSIKIEHHFFENQIKARLTLSYCLHTHPSHFIALGAMRL